MLFGILFAVIYACSCASVSPADSISDVESQFGGDYDFASLDQGRFALALSQAWHSANPVRIEELYEAFLQRSHDSLDSCMDQLLDAHEKSKASDEKSGISGSSNELSVPDIIREMGSFYDDMFPKYMATFVDASSASRALYSRDYEQDYDSSDDDLVSIVSEV
jgi:hypothetical protein